MSDNGARAPTDASTSPMGNTRDVTPTPLQRDISPFAREHLKNFPAANRRTEEHLRKKQTQSGHTHRG
jgi:hypothetical protein